MIRLSILSISVLDFLIPYILFRLTDANIRNFIEYPWNFIEYPWKNREIRRISWNIVDFSRKMRGKSFLFIPFLSISFLKLLPVDPFSRSFSVIFGRFCGHSWRKSENIGEFQRKSENIGENHSFSFRFHSFSFHFITISFLFIPQTLDFLPQMLNLTRYNKKVIFLFGRT